MEPDTVSTPKINRNTFKIGSGDLQQQVANNSRKITILSNVIRNSRSDIGKKITPEKNSIQETLSESNLILADIAIKLQEDFQSREQREKFLLQKSRSEKLELRRQNAEEELETQKTEKRIVKSTKKIKTPLDGLFNAIGKILLLFGGLTLIKTLINNKDNISNFFGSEQNQKRFKQVKETLDVVFDTLTKNMKSILVVGGVLLGLKLVSTLASVLAIGSSFLAIMSNPVVIAGLGLLFTFFALSKIGKKVFDAKVDAAESSVEQLKEDGLDEGTARILTEKTGLKNVNGDNILEGYGFPTTTNIDGDIGGNSFNNFMFNRDINKQLINQKNNNLKKENKKDGNVTIVELPGEITDLRKQKIFETPNGINATQVAYVPSTDSYNKYLSEFPILSGFSDTIYTG